MQNLMTICPPLTANNNTKQYDSTKSPLAMLEQTCRSIGADTSSNSKSSSQSIDHTKKDHANGSHLNKLSHLNGYKSSSLAINQLANLANGYEGGRRSGNSSEYARGSVSPASSSDKNRPNSNGNSRPNSNNSGNSSLTSSKGKELSKLSYKPYEDQQTNDKRKHHSPELEHLKSINKSGRKSNDSLNGSPKNSTNCCIPNSKSSSSNAMSTNLNYAQQQQLFESKYMELQYQQYMAALAAGYPFNPSLIAAASALTSNPLLNSNNNRNSNSSSTASSNAHTQTQTTNSLPSTTSTHQSLISSTNSCPPGCNSCIIHNPIIMNSFTTQTPSSVSASNNSANQFNAAQHLAALSSQYQNIPPHFLHLYGLAGYPSSALTGLIPPVSNSTSSSTNSTHSINHSHHNLSSNNQTLQQNLTANSNPNSLAMHQQNLANNSNQHTNSSSTSNKTAHICTFVSLNGAFCGKRFNSTDEYLIHLKSHPINDFPNLNPTSLESLYGSYEAILAANATNPALANLNGLRRTSMHDNLSNSRFHPYNKSSTSNNYSQNNNNNSSATASALSAMLPPLNAATGISPFPPLNGALGALSNLNGLNSLSSLSNLNNNSAAAAAAFYSQYANGRTVQP